ncbi:MAG: hypothetical protein M1814_004259 [Vezdaea aestivalis]|nr:MAG: hypothetical protein M1814_004259 [Vezdaea aestivalis]
MVLHNPNNWHWVNKDVSPWAREYLETTLVGLEAEDKGVTAKIEKVSSMDGDVDVSQRKGKVITLFDVFVSLEYSGKTDIGTDVTGSIKVPEVAHDTEEDEYVVGPHFLLSNEIDCRYLPFPYFQFEIDIHSDAKEKQPVKDLVRAKLIPQLRKHLHTLGPALISEHGKDIQHAPGSGPISRSSTPLQNNPTAPFTKAATSNNPKTDSNTSVNTVTLHETAEFQTTAAELYQTFTDPQRLAAFTRAPPKLFTGAKPGGRFELFGGNVSGEYVELEEPMRIVQKWRLGQWPAGHYSTMRIKFDQNDRDALTVMRVDWEGVPVGQEDTTKRNWGEYYIRSIKTTFGYVKLLFPRLSDFLSSFIFMPPSWTFHS